MVLKKKNKKLPKGEVFETLAILDNTHKDKHGVAKPSEEMVDRAKDWVDQNRL